VTDDELRRLQDAHGPDLLAYLARRIDEPTDSAALFNQVLEVVWRRARDVPPDPEQARMWMFGIASRLAANHRRSSARRLALTARLVEHLRAATAARSDDDSIDVRAAIRDLPPKQREVIRLVHWEGFRLEEVAQILGIPGSTARGRYRAARQRLAQTLSQSDIPTRRPVG
jgi:RNA polymerase sigma-70 factor (ECF subfamily)